jgi:microcystin-dependent protein
MSQPFVGEIKLLGFNWNPRGYALCAGQTLPVQQNAALFALLGTIYGGNGQSTFQLPNLQGRVAKGQGQGAGLSSYVIGEAAGVENASILISNMPSHTHAAQTTVTPNSSGLAAATAINVLTAPSAKLPGPVGNLITVPTVSGVGTPINAFAAPGTGTAGTMATGAGGAATTTITGSVSATAQTTNALNGGSIPLGILTPYLAINYSIALVGIFPSRS